MKLEQEDYGAGGKLAPGVEEGIEVKTKFPVARIKRIMQADEDVGKVAQVTPTAVCELIPGPIDFYCTLRDLAALTEAPDQPKPSNSS